MRFKTLGIVLLTATTLFIAFYWVTDPGRRNAAYDKQFSDLVAYGKEMFGPDNVTYDVSVTPDGFDPATVDMEVNATVQFTNNLGSDITIRGAGAVAFDLTAKAGAKASTRVGAEGLTTVTANGVKGSLAITSGPVVLNTTAANCANCHGADGTGGQVGTSGRLAPNLHSKSIYEKLKVQGGGAFTEVRRPGDPPDYVNLVIRFGGVVVSGNVHSPMPAWSIEAGGPLTVHQVDALTALVETWVLEAASKPDVVVPNTVEAGQTVYSSTSDCAGCHGADLKGVGQFPSLVNIGNAPVVDLPFPISGLDKLKADYAADPRKFLELWIRDSAANYNGGTATNMPPHPVESLSDSALQALITFLLSQKQ